MERQNLIKMGLLGLAVAALVYFFFYSKNTKVVENYGGEQNPFLNAVNNAGDSNDDETENFGESHGTEFEEFTGNVDVQASEALGNNEVYQTVSANDSGNQHPRDCFPKDQLTPAELLPGDANSRWAQSVPAGQGELGDQNFLTAGHHVGVNTVGQTLRNANRQIRSEPPNPQVKVSPWLQSTIEADTNRRPMEIGGCE